MTNHIHPQAVRDRFTAAMRELSYLMPLTLPENGARLVDAVRALERERDRIFDPRDAEIARLRSAVAYCRPRLKQDAHRNTLAAILHGDKDEELRNPDRTPMVQAEPLCSDCPPVGYSTEKTRCKGCPRGISTCHCGADYCGGDHRSDKSGLDDGPELRTARKKSEPKSPEVMADIRNRAWATRRKKYGKDGHR